MAKPILVYHQTISYFAELQQRPHHMLRLLAKKGYEIHWIEPTNEKDYMKEISESGITIWHNYEVFKRRFVGKIDILFLSWAYKSKDIEELNPKLVIYDSLDKFPHN